MKTTLHLCCLLVSIFMSGSLWLDHGVGAFNLDPYSVILVQPSVVTEPNSSTPSYFGYSHAFLREDNETWLIVGAPRANVSWKAGFFESGTVYKCRLADNAIKKDLCSELRMDYEEVNQSGYTSIKYNQWLGASMDVSSSSGELVTCGHRQAYLKAPEIKGNMVGVCFSRNNMKENTALRKSMSIAAADHEKIVRNRKNNDIYGFAFAQWGISVRFSTEGHILMGGPGSWQWQGGIFVNFGDTNCSIVNVTTEDSYLGYSVTSIRRPANFTSLNGEEFMFAGGAPRHGETGSVYTIAINHNNCVNRTVQEIKSTKYGSYFGASILAEDTNADGLDELFIGAPFENLTLGDEGAVHYYTNNGTNMFFNSTMLTGTKQAGGRFGTAIASIGDLNFDGFNDVIIGSPFEDEGRGAIYIFIGSRSGLVVPYSQRIAASDMSELRSVRSFGHSLSSGRDIDGNQYPDVSIGAYMNDSVAIMRARPVHTVTAEIWFPTAVIAWQRPNCSKTSESQSFNTILTISFFYTIPEQEKQNIKDTFILVDYQNRSASLGPNQTIVFTDESPSRHPLKFFVVPCLAKQSNKRCVSFLAAGHHATYMRPFDRGLRIENSRTPMNPSSYGNDVSFYLSEDLGYSKVVSIRCFSMLNYTLVSDENGKLTMKYAVEGEGLSKEANFTFSRGRYLPCIKNLSYSLSIDNDRRGFLQQHEGGGISSSVSENISFTVENLDEPLNRSWAVVFPTYPKNIAAPMKFQLSISGPSLRDSRMSSYGTSTDRISLDELSPVLNNLSGKTFSGQIGFYKECGDDDVCDANLSVNMTLTGKQTRGLVIGSLEILQLRFYVENTGETAYSVRLEIVHPSLFRFVTLSPEDSCNQVTATSFEKLKQSASSSLNMRELNCDVENQIHTNGSLAFKVSLDTMNFREESDFPMDIMKLQCRVGTHGHIRNGTESQLFQVPIRYEAALEAFRPSKDGILEFNSRAEESTNPDEKTLKLKHEYVIWNNGPGIMPNVTIDVLLPDDSIYNVSKITDVTVTVSGKRSGQQFERVINGTEIFENPFATTTISPQENENLNSTTAGQERESAFARILRSAIAPDGKKTLSMHCPTDPCSAIRRYNIGSMYLEDRVNVNITVAVSAVSLSKIKNLLKLTYTSSVRLSPWNLSADVKIWKEEKVKIDVTTLQTSTIFRSRIENPIPIWLIVVGVIIGALHIVACVLILKKCGFFRREQYERMKDQMRESRAEQVMSSDAEAEQQELGSQYDNELLREQGSVKSQSQDSAVGSYGNVASGDESKKTISSVDALLAQHPDIDFTAD